MAAQQEASPLQLDRAAETVEQRLQRLEDAVAALQDTRQIEERLLERLNRHDVPSPPEPERLSEQITTESQLPPPPEPLPSPPVDMTSRVIQAAPTVLRQAWLIADIYQELRSIIRMFFDVRYSVGWPARLAVLVLVPFILVSQWLIPFTGLPFIGPLLDKVVDLVLAFFLYKVLSREAQRYLQLQAARLGRR